MPPTGRPDIVDEMKRVHAELMAALWLAANGDIERTVTSLRADLVKVLPPADPGAAGIMDQARKIMAESQRLESSAGHLISYAQNVEGRLKGAADTGFGPPTDLDPTFAKLLNWVNTATNADLPGFPACVALLQDVVSSCRTNFQAIASSRMQGENRGSHPTPPVGPPGGSTS
jgi:hypothetical protein